MKKNIKKRILAKVFNVLHDAIKNTFEEECLLQRAEVPSQTSDFYGFSKERAGNIDTVSLRNFIHKKKEDIIQKTKKEEEKKKQNSPQKKKRTTDREYLIKKSISSQRIKYTAKEIASLLPPKYLYDLKLLAQNAHEYETIDINETYLSIYLKYLNYNDMSSFLNDFPVFNNKKDIKLQEEILNLPKGKLSSNAIKFKGYYFTNKAELHREVFILYLDLNNRYDGRKFPVRLEEFHKTQETTFNESKTEDDTVYIGNAEENSTFLHITLREDKNNRPLNIFCHKKFFPVENLKYMHAIVAAVSKDGMPISLEAILENQAYKDESVNNEKYFDAYLQLRRNNIRLPIDVISHPKNLRSKLTLTPVHKLESLPGTYRVWNFLWRKSGVIMQSKLTVHPNFRSDIETIYLLNSNDKEDKDDMKNQHCVLSISHVNNGEKLCFASHTPINAGMEVINYAILDIQSGTANHNILTGVFCGQAKGKGQKKYMVAEPLVFMKDTNDFEATTLGINKIKQLLDQNNPIYKKLITKLFKSYDISHNNKNDLTIVDNKTVSLLGKRAIFLKKLLGLYNVLIK